MATSADELSVKIDNLNLVSHAEPIMICDAWYGFPTQKRPRKERVLAVAKQIYNFASWRSDYMKQKRVKIGAAQVYVIGKVDDVEAIKERFEQLVAGVKSKKDDAVDDVDDAGDADDSCLSVIQCSFLPGKTLEDLSKELWACDPKKTHHETTTAVERIAYLSPDANEKLSTSQLPPRIVVVGMLVDRKVQPNRSKLRAESLGRPTANDAELQGSSSHMDEIVPMQLPLDSLNVSDLSDDEPLNIDTVMEMMQRWWINSNDGGGSSEDKMKMFFRDAAARALLTHRQRHPNRTLHGGASSGAVT